MGKAVVICCLLFFGLGACLGNSTASVEPEVVTVTKTKVVHEKPEKEVIYRNDSDCEEVVAISRKIAEAVQVFDSASSSQLDIISQGRIAIVQSDMNKLSKLEERQRSLNSKTVGAVSDMADLLGQLQKANDECLN